MGNEHNEDDRSTDEKTEKVAKGHSKNRASRNRNEKDRRDKLNECISELAKMVPGCSSPSRKLDKATVLKNTVDFMKLHNDLTVAITCKDSTSILSSNDLGQLMLEGSHAFLFVISLSGTFGFFSESVQDLLGYSKNALLGENIMEYIHPDDKTVLTNQLTRDSKPGGRNLNAAGSSFILRVKSKLGSAENQSYETLRCIGCFRMFDEGALDEVKSESEDSDESLTSNESCFVVMAEVILPNLHRNISNWMDDVVEFKSRQSMEGKFLYLDPRCMPVIGYLPYELLGSVMYELIHCDDLQSITKSFESMIDLGEGKTGNYRILTKGCQWIVIQTTNYISYNHWNSKPAFINSTHQLVRDPNNKETDSNVQVQQVSSAAEPDQSHTVESSKTDDSPKMSPTPMSHTLSSTMEKNLSGQPNMNSSLNSLTNYSQRPVCQTNTTSPIPTTTETSLTSIELVTRVIQDSDRTSKNDSRPEFNSQVTVDSNERMQNYLTSCRDVESSHLLSRSVVWKVPISSCNSPQTNKKNHFPSIVDEYPWPNVKMGERATLSPIGAHSNIGMYKETPSSPGRTVERISESPGRILNESHQSRIVDRYPKSPSEFSEGSPCPLARMVERYPRSPSGMSEGSPHLRTRMFDRYAQWPLGIPETSPQTPTNMFDQYPQSPSAMSQGSPQPPIRMVDRYPQSPAGVPEAPPQPPIGMVGRYSQSPSGVPESSPQPPIRLVDRYLQSPLAIPAASPQSTLEIPEISLEPQTRMVNRYLKSPSRIPLACTQTQPPTGVVNYYPHFSAAIPERSPPAFGLADTYSQLPVGVREGFSHSPNRTVDSYSQSPFEDGEGSSQLHTRVTDQSLQSPTQIPRGSPQPTTMMINSCLQPALLGVFERPGDSSYRQKLPDDIPLSFVGRTQCEMNLTYSENMQRTTLDQWNMSNSSELFSKSNCPMEKTNRDNTAIQVDPSSDEGCSSNEKLSFSSKNGADDLVDAGQILQKQLMAKQNQLQNVIQDQKRQLIEIQQQICLNAQAQYSLQEIADIETGKQFQRQAQILELERKQQEARQREIKSFVALKTNPTAVDTNSAKTIQQIMQLSYCGAAQPLGIEATGGQYASAVSTQSVITSSIASTSSQNILFKSSPNALKQLSSSTNPESSTQTINTSAEISTSATTTSTEDYFSKFTSSELGTFLSASSLSPSSSSVTSERSSLSGHTEKENNATQSSYDTLLVQQKQLLEMQEDQRRKLLLRQQEELLRIQQQQHGEMLLLQLEHSSLNSQEHTEQEPTTSSPQTQDHENRNLIFQSLGGLSGEPEQDTASTYELSEDDQCVINMLLNEGSDLEFWSEGIFKTTDYVP